ncbi:hypothetical protein NDU88_001816 [Pleurodeles waltl]|uniref:Secreted protein n=1 Tax=Pleurodeles waltl TaxID=8319 RepID=A0AAV7VCV6_PLEWA|nr:hypothetical protein NDU88_001816 [Pleurodeles waltl]
MGPATVAVILLAECCTGRGPKGKEIGRRRTDAAWRMVAERRAAQATDAEEECSLKEEESVARLQEAGNSGKA